MILFSCNSVHDENLLKKENLIRANVIPGLERSPDIIRFESRLRYITNSSLRTSNELMNLNSFEEHITKDLFKEKDQEWIGKYNAISSALQDNLTVGYHKPIGATNARYLRTQEDSLINLTEVLQQLDFSEVLEKQTSEGASSISDLIERLINITIIEGDSIAASGDFQDKSFEARIRIEVINFEDEVIQNEKIALDDKKSILETTSALLYNVENIPGFSAHLAQIADQDLPGGRTSGFFKKVGKFLKKVAATVAYAVTLAAFTYGGLVGGFALCGGYCGAAGGTAGLIVGHWLGSKLAYAISEDGPL